MNMVAFGDSRRAGSALFSKLIVQGTVRNATLLVMHKNWNGGPFGLQEQAYLRRSGVAAAARRTRGKASPEQRDVVLECSRSNLKKAPRMQ